jgi:hypothetical protein
MAYRRELPAAAQKHLKDADLLHGAERYDHAGYHYGMAAECALKGAFVNLGQRKIAEDSGAYYQHFPELKAAASALAGRLSHRIFAMLNRSNFMQEWHFSIRYAADRSIDQLRCEQWRKQAREFVIACAELEG